jgi:uncharacterized lipoprotein YbaY
MKQRTLTWISSIAVAAALAACSDSPPDDMPAPADNTVPLSAQASTSAWTSFAASLPDSDSSEPLDVNASAPPVSDTEEPRPL